MREVVGETPIAAGAGRRPRQDRGRHAAAVAGHPRLLRRRDRDHPGAAAEGRSAGPGHRRVPRRAGALADRERLRNEAEAYRNDIMPRARGDAARIEQEAEAYRQEIIARAQGDADRFISVYHAFKAAQDVTAERLYLETMEEVLKNSNKVIIDKSRARAEAACCRICRCLPSAAQRRRARRREYRRWSAATGAQPSTLQSASPAVPPLTRPAMRRRW